jgi:hypothetical protein
MVQEHLSIKLMLEYQFHVALSLLTSFIFLFEDGCPYG